MSGNVERFVLATYNIKRSCIYRERGAGFQPIISTFLEYISGGLVGSCLKKHGKFEESVVSSLTRQTLDGLSYLHREVIIPGICTGINSAAYSPLVLTCTVITTPHEAICKSAYLVRPGHDYPCYVRRNIARVGEYPYLGVRENQSLGIGLIGKDWGIDLFGLDWTGFEERSSPVLWKPDLDPGAPWSSSLPAKPNMVRSWQYYSIKDQKSR